MIIRLKDGSEKEYNQPMSVLDIAKDISEGLARNACAGEVNGETVDLRTVLDQDCELNILTFQDDKGKLAYLLAHRGGQVIVSVGLDGHFLHGSEEPAGGVADE